MYDLIQILFFSSMNSLDNRNKNIIKREAQIHRSVGGKTHYNCRKSNAWKCVSYSALLCFTHKIIWTINKLYRTETMICGWIILHKCAYGRWTKPYLIQNPDTHICLSFLSNTWFTWARECYGFIRAFIRLMHTGTCTLRGPYLTFPLDDWIASICFIYIFRRFTHPIRQNYDRKKWLWVDQ